MSKQHFFMFSSGSYSDYGVRGLYMCDHMLTNAEWDVFAADRAALVEKARVASIMAYSARTCAKPDTNHRGSVFGAEGWGSSAEYNSWSEYAASQDAQELFIRCHNLIEITYTELWRD